MDETAINWDSIPDIITKEQLYQICHISKSTALYLLRSGKIPCEYTGKKTRCYKIKKADVITYLEKRKVFPESYSAPTGWYKGNYTVKMKTEVPEQVLENMKLYYTELFAQYEADGSVNPAQIISLFAEEEEQREVAELFHARIHEVDSAAERDKALKETILRVKDNSISYRSAHLEPTDMQGLQQLVADKRTLQNMEKMHISID